MVYLLNMVIFHGELVDNQMVIVFFCQDSNKLQWVVLPASCAQWILMRAMDPRSLLTIAFLVSTVTTNPAKDEPRPEPKKSAAPAGSCWSVGFSFESCCAPEFGPEGNTECWDDVYTFESCCESGGDPQKVGCNSSWCWFKDSFWMMLTCVKHK